jgi:uncharacterized delta-60 repeat protein
LICLNKGHGTVAGLQGRDVSLTQGGRILVGGTYFASEKRQGAMFARLLPSGALDKSLRGDRRTRSVKKGVVKILPERGHIGSVRDVRPLAGGRVLAGGFLAGRFMAARFAADGGLDRNFGRRGVATFDLDGDPKCECSFGMAMVRDYRGRILIAGYTDRGGDNQDLRLAMVRLSPDGRLDRSFGKSGVARLGTPVDAIVRSIAVQRDGRIVVSGAFDRKFGLARFNSNGSPDRTFFNDGIFTEYVFGTFGSAWDVLMDKKDRILATGGSESGGFAVMRILPR